MIFVVSFRADTDTKNAQTPECRWKTQYDRVPDLISNAHFTRDAMITKTGYDLHETTRWPAVFCTRRRRSTFCGAYKDAIRWSEFHEQSTHFALVGRLELRKLNYICNSERGREFRAIWLWVAFVVSLSRTHIRWTHSHSEDSSFEFSQTHHICHWCHTTYSGRGNRTTHLKTFYVIVIVWCVYLVKRCSIYLG